MDRKKLIVTLISIIGALIYVFVIQPKLDPGDVGEPPGEDSDIVLDEDAYSPRGNREIGTFDTAKDKLLEIFEEAGWSSTFYCGCEYEGKGVDLGSCGYGVRKNERRAGRVEVEHVVPASAFGQAFRAWREGHSECVRSDGDTYKGRSCARKTSLLFRTMEADLYNLQPAIGEVNGDRSNYSMAVIPGEAREYGRCDVEIEDRKIEPRPAIRGDVARTYLYMDWAYPGLGIISRKNRKLFGAWSREDPVDDAERERARRIQAIQGNTNPFIE